MDNNLTILFENNDLLVVDKPFGLVVNKAETQKDKITLHDLIVEKYPEVLNFEKDEEFTSRAGIIHRLDKDTSGLIIVAKNPKAFKKLQKQFKDREVVKKYTTLVFGKIRGVEKGEDFEISAPIMRNPRNREKFAVSVEGKESTTLFKVEDVFDKGNNTSYTLLECTPKTGRTHQIRVHLTALGNPVVGDKTYSGKRRSRQFEEQFPRQFLHASYLEFKNPSDNQIINVKSRLPMDLQNMLNSIKDT